MDKNNSEIKVKIDKEYAKELLERLKYKNRNEGKFTWSVNSTK